jgi:signal transduction histidine kinase
MRESGPFAWRQLRPVKGDVLLAATIGVGIATCLAIEDASGLGTWSATLLLCGAMVVRRPLPIVSAGAVAAIGLILRIAGDMAIVNNNGLVGDATTISAFLVVFLTAYSLGARCDLISGLVGVGLMLLGLNLAVTGFNPFLEVLVLGPWLGGRVVGTRRRITEQLEARARDLSAEQEHFSDESVRYERARMARELHDIVAHNVSVMVVQAGAGQRLVTTDPERAAEALDSIAETAMQAEEEVDRLVRMLGNYSSEGQRPSLGLVEQLVCQASSTGVEITCRFEGDCDGLSVDASDAAYRMVQEAITNALKYAPGSPITVCVRKTEPEIELEIVNGPPRHRVSGLEGSGGGHGIQGMRERIEACAGRFESGATPDRGWRVFAAIPTVA